MRILKILFFLCSSISIVHGANIHTTTCPSYSCHSSVGSQPQNTCTCMNLTCRDHEMPVVKLPYAGEFYARKISYDDTDAPFVQLYDPENCLIGRLMHHLNLSSSPYKAILYENYTYYMCPSNSDPSYYPNPPVICLSNSTDSTVAVATTTHFSPSFVMESGCKVLGSWKLPVLEPRQFEGDGVNSDLYLTWNLSTCGACQETQDQLIAAEPLYVDTSIRFTSKASARDKSRVTLEKIASAFHSTPACMALAVVILVCLLAIIKCIHKTEPADTVNNLPEHFSNETQSNATGLDEAEINVCTELVVLGVNRIISAPDCNTICSICLESYVGGEMVRNIEKCGHCFHAYCIELWMRRNITCPICRVLVVGVAEF